MAIFGMAPADWISQAIPSCFARINYSSVRAAFAVMASRIILRHAGADVFVCCRKARIGDVHVAELGMHLYAERG